jgi:hypothetical protein
VRQGGQVSVTLNIACQAIITANLTDCVAFMVLYRDQARHYSQASLIHMNGGPDAGQVNWQGMVQNMPNVPETKYYAIVACSMPTMLSDNFLQAVAQNLPMIPAANTWLYNQITGGMDFGVDWNGFVGDPLRPPN